MDIEIEVLLVDDNPVQASTRQTILNRAGVATRAANSATEALRMLSEPELRTSLRLLVTDHLMPGMNGPEFVGLARDILPTLQVIVISGLADAEQEYESLDVCFRLKPLPPEELIRAVRDHLAGRCCETACA